MSQPIIKVENLTYFYPKTKALKDVSFSIGRGDITALVGPNGSGKTTLLRSLAGLDMPFSGSVEIANVDVIKDPRKAHTTIGYLSDDFGLYQDLTVRDVLTFIGGCHGIKDKKLEDVLDWVIDLLRLESVIDKKCKELSRGWRQRVGIAMSILHKPDVLLLDEPASGLDPEARSELSAIMRKLQSEGMTSLVSSHILAELEEYCTSMLVLREGVINQHVSLKEHIQTQNISLKITLLSPLTAAQEKTIVKLSGHNELLKDETGTVISIAASHDPETHHSLLKGLLDKKVPVCGFTVKETSLQSLYLETSAASEGEEK